DDTGRVIATSRGFAYNSDEPTDDYTSASQNAGGLGSFIGRSANGEHVIAVTQLLANPIGDVQAMRFVSSLRLVDRQLLRYAQLVIFVCLLIISFVVFSGVYFIRSIVIP
ncbi:MAG: sensor histidine kinase, partial [Oscillospiraceae bacterium]